MAERLSFGSWLRQRRRFLDLTRDELARRIGYSVSTLRRIEADELRPSRQLAETLADQLDLASEEREAFIHFARGDANGATIPLPTVAVDLPPRSDRLRPLGLIVPSTPLIGRETDLAALRQMVGRDEVRLITLVGPGGTGKTRLAYHLAADIGRRFADGVCLVNLAPVTDPDLVPSAIAQALDVREASHTPLDALRDALHDQNLLLVLDNFEQVIDAAPTLADLLRDAPGVKCLVTSRTILRLRIEHVYQVPALGLPPLPESGGQTADSRQGGPDGADTDYGLRITDYPAIQLFVERAQAADPHFTLTDKNTAAIAEICRRLDGLPLAIELAAARTRLLPPPDLLHRLAGAAGRMPLLTGGPRDVPPRQQTLRNTMAWSYELLSEAEKPLFRRLAVFVGGWTLEAAEAICDLNVSAGSDPLVRPSSLVHILDSLDSLVDKSLVRRAPSVEPRFTMLETVREYAQERLAESGETDELRRRHARFYLSLAETAAPGLRGPRQIAWLERLEAEHDNLRAALDWCLAADEPALAVRFAAALYWFWILHGYISEGRQRVEGALTAMSNATPPAEGWPADVLAARARTLEGAARLARAKSKVQVAHDCIDESLAIWRALGDKRGIAQALRFQANVYQSLSQAERRRLLKESRLLYEEAGDEWGLADAMLGLADIAANAKDYERAATLYDDSQRLFERLGDRLGVGWVQKSRAFMLYYKGDYSAARGAYEQALDIFHTIGDRHNVGGIWNMQGELARSMGDYATARACYQQAHAAYLASGREWHLDIVAINLGYVALYEGDIAQAARLFHGALLNYRQRGETDDTCLILAAIAGLAACASTRAGERDAVLEAARLLGGVAGRLEAIGFSLDPADQMVFDHSRETVLTWLGNADFEVAWFEGYAMPLAQTMVAAMNTVVRFEAASSFHAQAEGQTSR